jgi:hypothetical protein
MYNSGQEELFVLRARSLARLRRARDDGRRGLWWRSVVFVFGHLLPMNEQNKFVEQRRVSS